MVYILISIGVLSRWVLLMSGHDGNDGNDLRYCRDYTIVEQKREVI